MPACTCSFECRSLQSRFGKLLGTEYKWPGSGLSSTGGDDEARQRRLFTRRCWEWFSRPYQCSCMRMNLEPNPGYTAAPGDNATACITAGCHVGTVNSGAANGGKVQIVLPTGNSGTYVPGQAMKIPEYRLPDFHQKVSYGFQMVARMGNGNLTQAGDFQHERRQYASFLQRLNLRNRDIQAKQ